MIHAISVHGGDNMMALIDVAFDFDSNNHGRCDKKAIMMIEYCRDDKSW